jgi:hypothetical protein
MATKAPRHKDLFLVCCYGKAIDKKNATKAGRRKDFF